MDLVGDRAYELEGLNSYNTRQEVGKCIITQLYTGTNICPVITQETTIDHTDQLHP